jgi:hypothetical protein
VFEIVVLLRWLSLCRARAGVTRLSRLYPTMASPTLASKLGLVFIAVAGERNKMILLQHRLRTSTTFLPLLSAS